MDAYLPPHCREARRPSESHTPKDLDVSSRLRVDLIPDEIPKTKIAHDVVPHESTVEAPSSRRALTTEEWPAGYFVLTPVLHTHPYISWKTEWLGQESFAVRERKVTGGFPWRAADLVLWVLRHLFGYISKPWSRHVVVVIGLVLLTKWFKSNR
jgi:hypothetical protein